MRFKKELKDLKKGDKIVVEYRKEIVKAKVLANNPDERSIYFRIGGFFRHNIIKTYNSYCFENFNLLNN